jgi:cephalosporin hydroxylase
MNIDDIARLAELSRGPVDMGEYANRRAAWAYDPAYAAQEMWWGQEQAYYKFMYLLTQKYPGLYVEIGTHKGIAFACAAAGGQASDDPAQRFAVGVDIVNYDEANDVARQYKRARFIHGSSMAQTTIAAIEATCKETKLDIAIMFVDARHTMADANSELRAYKHLYHRQAVLWVFDDVIAADNNTHLPLMFERLPGQKLTFPNLHTDNCVAVALVTGDEHRAWDPGSYTTDELSAGFRTDEAKGRLHHERW